MKSGTIKSGATLFPWSVYVFPKQGSKNQVNWSIALLSNPDLSAPSSIYSERAALVSGISDKRRTRYHEKFHSLL